MKSWQTTGDNPSWTALLGGLALLGLDPRGSGRSID